jgi:hypothetical protein
MFMDYWVGEILQFLASEVDPRSCVPGPCKKLIENTLVIYQSDNGFMLPSSKASKRENGFRTPILVRAPVPIPTSVPSVPPVNRSLASALDILPTAVDYATNGVISYRSCDAADPHPPDDSPFAVKGGQCIPVPGATLNPPNQPNHPDNCGCLPGKSLHPLASFTRDELYGERRDSKGGMSGAYLRLRIDPEDLPSSSCLVDEGELCHIRIERPYPASEQDGCPLRAYDVLKDPDAKDDLMKQSVWSSSPQKACWNARLNQFVRVGERCGTYAPCP